MPQQSWEQLYEGNADGLVAYATQFGFSFESAQDIVHDAFLRVFGKDRDPEHPNPKALLFQCVRWTALDRLKKNRRRLKREADATDLLVDTASSGGPDGKEFAALVSKLLRQLPDEQREVLVLHLWGDLSFREIGEQLGISPNTASSRYRYGLEKIRSEAGELKDFFSSRIMTSTL